MKSYLEYCTENNVDAVFSAMNEEADFGEINIGKFIAPVMKRMASLIGDEGMQAVVDTVDGYGSDSPEDYHHAKKDIMKALWASEIPDDKSWIEKQYEFWAGCLARAVTENDPSVLAKILKDLQKEMK